MKQICRSHPRTQYQTRPFLGWGDQERTTHKPKTDIQLLIKKHLVKEKTELIHLCNGYDTKNRNYKLRCQLQTSCKFKDFKKKKKQQLVSKLHIIELNLSVFNKGSSNAFWTSDSQVDMTTCLFVAEFHYLLKTNVQLNQCI